MPNHAKHTLIEGQELSPIENLQGIIVMSVGRKFTLEEVFEAEAFGKDQICLPLWGTLRVIAKDGASWATVRGFTPLGNVILAPDQPLAVRPTAPAKRAA